MEHPSSVMNGCLGVPDYCGTLLIRRSLILDTQTLLTVTSARFSGDRAVETRPDIKP